MAPTRQSKLSFAPSSSTVTSRTSSPKSASSAPSQRAKLKTASGGVARVQTDVILCIKPEFVRLIVKGDKNHEFRKYKLKDSVRRLWFYETAPTSSITCIRILVQIVRPR